MDGTLIDSGNVITNTINFVRVNIGLEPIEKTTLLTQLNNPDINAADFFYGTDEFTQEQTELFTQYYDQHCISDIMLYDGIEDLLKELSKDFKLSIATNASVQFASKMLKYLNIDRYFNFTIGACSVKNPKPYPDMVIKTLKYFNVDAKDAIVVGDSYKDKKAALGANVDFILVDWGFTNFDDNEAIKSIDTLKAILLNK